jgi:succinate dehydrogenase/fumarate reductase iron-sulfur protein
MAESITANVFRYNPSVDAEPSYSSYEVPWEGDDDPTGYMTGMQVLNYIYDNIEPIGCDYACTAGLCGKCAMMIDGKPGLACWTVLEPGEHTFEPLTGLPIIRDLKVDQGALYDRFVDVDLENKTVNPIEKIKDIDYELYWNTLERMNMCRECMCCYATCSALQIGKKWETFIGPGAMAGIGQRYLDPHDESDRISQAAFSGVFECIQCGNCTAVCPAAIDVKEIIGQMQAAAEKKGLKPA